MKWLADQVFKYNVSIAFHPIKDVEDLFYPQYNPFLFKEKPSNSISMFILSQSTGSIGIKIHHQMPYANN